MRTPLPCELNWSAAKLERSVNRRSQNRRSQSFRMVCENKSRCKRHAANSSLQTRSSGVKDEKFKGAVGSERNRF
jgi:hypothetical protein